MFSQPPPLKKKIELKKKICFAASLLIKNLINF